MGSEVDVAYEAAQVVKVSLLRAGELEMKNNDTKWDLLEALIDASKKAEILRQEIARIREGRYNQRHATVEKRVRNHDDDLNYPKYIRRNDSLVRIGLKRSGEEYEHVVKRKDFEKIIRVIAKYPEGVSFTVDDLQKELNIPQYLTYTTVSLLRDETHHLKNVTRGIYQLNEGADLEVESIIAKLNR